MVDVRIRQERAAEVPDVRRVVADAFAAEPAVADLVDRLRTSSAWRPEMSRVAVTADGAVVGHVLATRAWLDTPKRLVEVLLLSPLSVAPDMQGQGVGSLLVNDLLDLARAAQPEPAMFLEGPPAYYSRFGFEAAGRYGVERPSSRIPEEALQVVWLRAWSEELTGRLVYPDPFWELDCVGLR